MKRLLILAAAVLLAAPMLVSAQTATVLPFDPLTPVPALPALPALDAQAQPAGVEDAAARADLAAGRAEFAASQSTFALEQAAATVERADSMLNQFQTLEAVVSIVGFVVPVLLVLAAFFGLNRLNSAQKEVAELRKEVNAEIDRAHAASKDQITVVREEVSTEIQAAKAQLAEEITRGQHEMEALRQTAQTVRQEASRARLANALLLQGERQFKVPDLAGAIETYQRALALDDQNPVTHYRLGYIFNQQGRLEEALHHLAAALDIDKDFLPARAALGYTYRRQAEALPDGDNQREMLFAEAEKRLRDVLDKSPRLVDEDGESWWGSLGGLYKRRGQINLAKDAYRRGSEVTPHSSYTIQNLAVLEMKDGRRDEMLQAFRKVERVAKAETQAKTGNYYGLADLMTAQLALGKTKEAQETMQTWLEVAPSGENALELERDTLRMMLNTLGGEAEAPHVAETITAIEAEMARRHAAPAQEGE